MEGFALDTPQVFLNFSIFLLTPIIGAGGAKAAKSSAPPALAHGTPIIIIFGATPIGFHYRGSRSKVPHWHHYRGTMSNTHGAPLSFLLWGHIPLEQRIGGLFGI